jgi:hypothetical protein
MVKVLIPMYKPLKIERCEKCGKVIAEPKEPIRKRKHGKFTLFDSPFFGDLDKYKDYESYDKKGY